MIVYAVVEHFNRYEQAGGVVQEIYSTKESAEHNLEKHRTYEDSTMDIEVFKVKD